MKRERTKWTGDSIKLKNEAPEAVEGEQKETHTLTYPDASRCRGVGLSSDAAVLYHQDRT